MTGAVLGQGTDDEGSMGPVLCRRAMIASMSV